MLDTLHQDDEKKRTSAPQTSPPLLSVINKIVALLEYQGVLNFIIPSSTPDNLICLLPVTIHLDLNTLSYTNIVTRFI